MRASFTPEEVDQIEEKAYEVGERIGRNFERERIITLLEAEIDETALSPTWIPVALAIALIKGENK